MTQKNPGHRHRPPRPARGQKAGGRGLGICGALRKVPTVGTWPGRGFQPLELLVAALVFLALEGVAQQTRIIRNLPGGGVQIIEQGSPVEEVQTAPPEVAPIGPSNKLAQSWNPNGKLPLSATDAQQLVSRAMSLDYQRTSYNFYRALEEKRKRTGPGTPAEVFYTAVYLGDWEMIGRLLARLPVAQATQVYDRMLAALAKQAKPPESLFKRYQKAQTPTEPADPNDVQQMASYASYRSSRPDAMGGVFLSDDFFGVVEAAPGPLTPAQVQSLAILGRVALPGDSGQRQMAERLKAGLKGLREEVPAECTTVARLLCAMGWTRMAEPFLPATAREVSDLPPEDALLAADYHAAAGAAERDERQSRRGWELLCAASARGADDAQVADRVIDQLRHLDDDFVRSALPALLTNKPALSRPLLARVAQAVTTASSSSSSDPDDESEPPVAASGPASSLRVQSLLMEAIVAASPDGGKRTELFNGLVWSWLHAAEQARATTEEEETRRAREAMYGGRVTYGGNQRGRVSAAQALASAPAENVIDTLGQGLGRQVRLMKFALGLLDFDEQRSAAYLRLCCKLYAADSRDLCSHYLAAWVDDRSSALAKEDPEIARARAQGYMPPQAQRPAGGIPLTRARQNRNVRELNALLKELRTLAPALDPSRTTWAFVSIHSGAEVYRAGDIEAIFGPPEAMDHAELRTLLSAMRINLARSWRDPQVQQKAGSNRTEQEIKDEVSRGYGVALDLLKRGLGFEGGDWEDGVLRGQLCFDAAEFEKDRGITLADYVNLRDASFAGYRFAAQLYGSNVLARPRGQWTIAPFQAWFFAMLGASDLAALTPRQARNDLGLQGVRAALTGLPPDAATEHLRLFAASLTNLLERVPSHMRQKFLAAGVEVVGPERPEAAPAQAVLDYYANLVEEAQLRVTVDGPTRIGHGQPFGLFIALEHTKQLAREGGGFAKYLQNQSAQMAGLYGGYSPPGQKAMIDYRDDFATNFHQAVGAQFDVQSLVFHDPTVKPIDLPREGWQAMPLAYAVLKAKDPAVDRIPSIQLDMDFADQKGTVVLPVLSQVIPVNAIDKTLPPRACAGLEVGFTLDQRDWRAGKLALEISATGRGIIPDLADLCDPAQKGLEMEVKDSGLVIQSVQTDKGRMAPQATRSWQIAYYRDQGASAPAVFRFPALAGGFTNATAAYKRYVDADLETMDGAKALAGIALPAVGANGKLALWIVVGVGGLLAMATAMIKGRRVVAAPRSAAELPRELTPFTVVAFLRRLGCEPRSGLQPADREALQKEIEGIESAYFSAAGASAPIDLRAVAEQWRRKAAGS